MNCINCNNKVNSKFCPDCGQPAELKRIDGHYIIHEIEHVLHFEKGIFYTIKELLIRPGKSVREFISENRNRLVKPIIFIIVTSLIYSLSVSFFDFEDGYVGYSGRNESTTTKIFEWVQGHYGYANIMMGIFIALWIKIFFRKHPFNIFEIIILLCFVMGLGMLILSIFGIVEGLTQLKILQFGAMLVVFYTTWAIGQFYGKRKIFAYVKALFAYILGMSTFYLILMVIGTIIDLINKH